MPEITFTNWDGRPAVLLPDGSAFAVLGFAGEWDPEWVPVDALDVAHTAAVWDRATWCSAFRRALAAAGRWPGYE